MTQVDASQQVSFQEDARVGQVARACGQMVEAGGWRRDQKNNLVYQSKLIMKNFHTNSDINSPAVSIA